MFASVQTEYASVTFHSKYRAQFYPQIDKKQLITYNVKASGSGSGDKKSAVVEFFLPSEVKDARSQITTKINNYMSSLKSFNFKGISSFALTQVLFPNQNVFSFTEVYIPGDMIILEPDQQPTISRLKQISDLKLGIVTVGSAEQCMGGTN